MILLLILLQQIKVRHNIGCVSASLDKTIQEFGIPLSNSSVILFPNSVTRILRSQKTNDFQFRHGILIPLIHVPAEREIRRESGFSIPVFSAAHVVTPPTSTFRGNTDQPIDLN